MSHIDDFRSLHRPKMNVVDIVRLAVTVHTATVDVQVQRARLGVGMQTAHVHGVAEIGLDLLLHAIGCESYGVQNFQCLVLKVCPVLHGEVGRLLLGGREYKSHHEPFELSPHRAVCLMQLTMVLHHIPDGCRVETVGQVVHLDRPCLLLLQCVPHGIATVRHRLCEHNHVASFPLVCPFDVMFSSMLYQCWISPVTASTHQRMNRSLRK